MNQRTLLPKSPWANNLEQRAMAFAREQMHHAAIDPGHYLHALTTAGSHELPARRFMRIVPIDSYIVSEVVKSSQPRNAVGPMIVEPLTSAAGRMRLIANLMAEDRQKKYTRREGAQLIQEDFIVGVLLSGSSPVDVLLAKQRISPTAIFDRLGLKLPSPVIDLLVDN